MLLSKQLTLRPIDTIITGGRGQSNKAAVSRNGELITAPLSFDMGIRKVLDSTGTAFNHVEPESGRKFIITGLVINADKNVTGSAVTQFYEADSPTNTTASTTLLTIDVPKNETVVITNIRMETSTGVYLNSKTDDATVNYMVLGHFVDV